MFAKRKRNDNGCSSEDRCFPHVKGFREEGSLNHKIDSLSTKDSRIYVDLPWEKCLYELAWKMKDTHMGCNK
jgi:hypothetical protein